MLNTLWGSHSLISAQLGQSRSWLSYLWQRPIENSAYHNRSGPSSFRRKTLESYSSQGRTIECQYSKHRSRGVVTLTINFSWTVLRLSLERTFSVNEGTELTILNLVYIWRVKSLSVLEVWKSSSYRVKDPGWLIQSRSILSLIAFVMCSSFQSSFRAKI